MGPAQRHANASSIERVCQIVIDADILAPYYHPEDAPNRKPLFLVEGGLVNAGLRLTKFGMTVRIAPRAELVAQGRPYLEFRRLEVQSEWAEVHFAYPVEGVVGRVTLERSGDDEWDVREKSLNEQ